MRLHCEFSIPVARTDLDDYIRHLEISVGCYDEDGLQRVHRRQAGRRSDYVDGRPRGRRFPV